MLNLVLLRRLFNCSFLTLFHILELVAVVVIALSDYLSQVCARGYFSSDLGDCLPCNCRGHADSCEDITGICIVSLSRYGLVLTASGGDESYCAALWKGSACQRMWWFVRK